MRPIEEIYSTYLVIDRFLRSDTLQEGKSPFLPSEKMLELNEHAFYVLLFGELQDFVEEEYVGWKGDSKAPFMTKVSVVVDYNDVENIRDYYQIRTEIAHGRKRSIDFPIDMAEAYRYFDFLITQ